MAPQGRPSQTPAFVGVSETAFRAFGSTPLQGAASVPSNPASIGIYGGLAWPARPSYTVRVRPPGKYPKMVDLSRTVERYEAALEAGRVTNRVGGGPCLDVGEAFVDFSDWDPSKPAPSIYVEVIVEEIEAVELVTALLEDHGISYWVSYHYVEACVPVPLLASLSELPGVRRIELVPPFESDSPTLLEGVSWGAVKDRFK